MLGYTNGSPVGEPDAPEGARAQKDMAQEIEVKCKVEDLAAFRKTLARIGARPVAAQGQTAGEGKRTALGRVHEMNELFDTPQGGFAKHGHLVRVRVEKRHKKNNRGARSERVVLTYKSPAMRPSRVKNEAARGLVRAGRHKIREEVEAEVGDAGALRHILEEMGLRGWFRYEKYRTTYRLPRGQRWAKGLLIELDETPSGNYVELEGPAEAIDRAAGVLGFRPRDYITKSYLQIYLEDCRRRGVTPGDMLFGPRNRKKLL